MLDAYSVEKRNILYCRIMNFHQDIHVKVNPPSAYLDKRFFPKWSTAECSEGLLLSFN